eukprot:scaffold67760_cov16-Tisochrysis_lutea.AAC.2
MTPYVDGCTNLCTRGWTHTHAAPGCCRHWSRCCLRCSARGCQKCKQHPGRHLITNGGPSPHVTTSSSSLSFPVNLVALALGASRQHLVAYSRQTPKLSSNFGGSGLRGKQAAVGSAFTTDPPLPLHPAAPCHPSNKGIACACGNPKLIHVEMALSYPSAPAHAGTDAPLVYFLLDMNGSVPPTLQMPESIKRKDRPPSR